MKINPLSQVAPVSPTKNNNNRKNVGHLNSENIKYFFCLLVGLFLEIISEGYVAIFKIHSG
jgi:hypothetical protein